jgi:hypothetical protein
MQALAVVPGGEADPPDQPPIRPRLDGPDSGLVGIGPPLAEGDRRCRRPKGRQPVQGRAQVSGDLGVGVEGAQGVQVAVLEGPQAQAVGLQQGGAGHLRSPGRALLG